MKTKQFLITTVFALSLIAGSGYAGDQDFTLINQTGDPIEAVYVSASQSDDWEEDVLGQDILENGDSTEISFSRSATACKWDLKVRYPDGDEPVWYNIDLCELSAVTIHWDEENERTFATGE